MWKKMVYNQQAPFWLLTFSVLLVLTVPNLIRDGMFMDAMLYTSVSHNLSKGIGTFWFPQFSLHNIAGLSSFHEQPPLVFGIQAFFFNLLGDSMYTERMYTFLTLCISSILIASLWREAFRNRIELKGLAWLPLFLWITIPICYWSYSNNMHENTMGIFTLSSVLLTYKAFHAGKRAPLLLGFSGLFIFLATLSKGFPGFFPLAVPLLYWATTGKIRLSRSIIQTIFLILIPGIIYLILFIIPESGESLSVYLFSRALHRIQEAPTVDSRLYILGRLLMEIVPQFLIVSFVILLARWKKMDLSIRDHIREIIFFLMVGFAASAPLMLTLVQKGFYLVPALPYMAIGLSMIIAPVVLRFTDRIFAHRTSYRIWLVVSAIILAGTISFSLFQIGKFSRNKELLHDVYLIGKVVPAQSVVDIPLEMWNEWDLQCYLQRYFHISVDTGYTREYTILDRTLPASLPPDYIKVDMGTIQYDLYQKP